jgi:hypothetical protein
MKKAPLFAIAALTTLFAAATPALAHDGPSFSFGIMVGDGGYRGQPRYYERDRYVEREPCPEDYRYRSYYGRPHYYGPRVVIIDRGREHWRREHWRHHRDWDWR